MSPTAAVLWTHPLQETCTPATQCHWGSQKAAPDHAGGRGGEGRGGEGREKGREGGREGEQEQNKRWSSVVLVLCTTVS